jgi:hypothetical protein
VYFETICGTCNTKFGRLYVPALLDWYWGGQYILERVIEQGYAGARFQADDMYPLRIIKGVIAMNMAINPERFRSTPEGASLAQLLDDQYAKGLPETVHIFTYLNYKGTFRYIPLSLYVAGITPSMTAEEFLASDFVKVSEITYPPYGFMMAIGPTTHIDPRLFCINQFAGVDYDQQASVIANILLLETHAGLSLNDYRTEDEWRAPFDRDTEQAESE